MKGGRMIVGMRGVRPDGILTCCPRVPEAHHLRNPTRQCGVGTRGMAIACRRHATYRYVYFLCDCPKKIDEKKCALPLRKFRLKSGGAR